MKPKQAEGKQVDRKSFTMSYSKDVIVSMIEKGLLTKDNYKEELLSLYKYIESIY
jgi:hypothetical protein